MRFRFRVRSRFRFRATARRQSAATTDATRIDAEFLRSIARRAIRGARRDGGGRRARVGVGG
ncbi:hypothetical protein N9D08_00990 [bacterium]|nr:hypothetical protein [bacterium]